MSEPFDPEYKPMFLSDLDGSESPHGPSIEQLSRLSPAELERLSFKMLPENDQIRLLMLHNKTLIAQVSRLEESLKAASAEIKEIKSDSPVADFQRYRNVIVWYFNYMNLDYHHLKRFFTHLANGGAKSKFFAEVSQQKAVS